MLKNTSPCFSKGMIFLLIGFTLLASCSKNYEPGNILEDRIELLTSKTGSESWALNTVRINNVLDVAAKGSLKRYHTDGTFTDNLGFVGFWTMYSRDSLIESTRSSVNPDAPYFTKNFHIDNLDKGSLQLTYTDGDKKISLAYDSNK